MDERELRTRVRGTPALVTTQLSWLRAALRLAAPTVIDALRGGLEWE